MDATEILLTFGGEIKVLDDGHFGGYLVRFSSADDPDLVGDYFTKDTDFGFTGTIKSPVYFNHRLPLKTKDGKQLAVKSKIGESTLSITDDGVLIDAILFNREKYEKAIVAAGKANKLGWSSGTAKHLVDRETNGYIKTWPLGLDASATPTPCEPQNIAIESKALEAVKFAPVDDVLVLDAPPAELDIKGLFAEALAERSPSSWELDSAFRDVLREIAQAAGSSNVTGVSVDVRGKVQEAASEYLNALVDLATIQIGEWAKDEDTYKDPFYLKNVFDELKDAPAASRFLDHLQVVLAAAQEVQTRAKSLHELRVKSGRVLSDANRKRLSTLLASLSATSADIDALLKETEPQPKSIDLVDPDTARGLVANFELFRMRHRIGEQHALRD